MRPRELRLGRSLRRIVLSVLASPLAGGAVACGNARSPAQGSLDATVPRGDAAADEGGAGAEDAGVDATIDASPDASDDLDCGAIAIDGASLEGPQDGCVAYRLLPCGLPPTAQLEGCFVDLKTCVGPCSGSFFLYCKLAPISCDDAGNVLDAETVVECTSCNGISGRRPRGLATPRVPRRTPVGDHFAAMAHLESASVRAFRDLARWLASEGAPARLSLAALRSADDERRHARVTARLARRFGGTTAPPRVRRVPPPTLVELVEDDAVEGCVKETFGALLATWQAERADDPRVRQTLRRIAADETRHAALAWEILRWGMPRLSARERRRVRGALGRAHAGLGLGAAPVHPDVCRVAGYPGPEHQRRLAGELARLVRVSVRRSDWEKNTFQL